jgi:hypothetical protein
MENLKITIKKAQKKSGQDRRKIVYLFFFHPDYTVGFGISPNQSKKLSWTITTGRELLPHPALKIKYSY